MDEWNAHPVSVSIPLGQGLEIYQAVDGIGLANAMLNVMNISRLIPMVPKSFYQICGGDYAALGYALTTPAELNAAIHRVPAPMAMQLVKIADSAQNLVQVCKA